MSGESKTPVLDASALLAFVQGEPGAEVVDEALLSGAVVGAANWSEVAQKVLQHGLDWGLTRALLLSYDLDVQPVTVVDAERAASRWARHIGLSLGDRLCLSLAERIGGLAFTADVAWGTSENVRQIR